MQKNENNKGLIAVSQITKENISTFRETYPDNWRLLLCDKGTADFVINQATVRLTKNCIMSIPPNRSITLVSHSDDITLTQMLTPITTPVMFADISEDPHLTQRLIQIINTTQLHDLLEYGQGRIALSYHMPDDDVDDLRRLIEVLKHRLKGHSENFHTLHTSLIDAIAMIVIESTTLSNLDHQPHTKQTAIVRKFFEEMFIHYKDHHDVAFYAKQLGMSAKYISTVIKEETGLSALQWLNHIVTYKAKQLIQNSNLSVAEIAALLHFSSPSAFIRHFKNQTGITPLAYKK